MCTLNIGHTRQMNTVLTPILRCHVASDGFMAVWTMFFPVLATKRFKVQTFQNTLHLAH